MFVSILAFLTPSSTTTPIGDCGCSSAIIPFNYDEEQVPIGPQPRPPNPINIPHNNDVGTDAPPANAEPAEPAADWPCPACTYLNKAADSECDICGTLK